MRNNFILFLFFCPVLLFGQHGGCDALIRDAKALAKSLKFDDAIKKVQAAKGCASPADIDKLYSEIFEGLKKQTKEAQDAKTTTEKALKDLQVVSNQAVTILLAEIDRNIYQLEYDSTYKKCQTAVALNAQRSAVERRIWEIAYFYTVADTGLAAIPFLELIKPTGLNGTTPGWQNKLQAFLDENIPPNDSAFIHDRYFPKLITVAGGSFFLKDEEYEDVPGATVKVNTFQMAATETTNWQFNIFAKAKHIKIEPPLWQFAGDNPVVNVNWKQATLYLNWLSDRLGKKEHVYDWSGLPDDNFSDVVIDYTAKGYRLPTEAEWEYAAGGGSKERTKYAGTSEADSLLYYAWLGDNSGSRTHAVGTKTQNALGLYDMSGNVWEWCQDWYDAYDPDKTDNPVKSETVDNRVDRGGGWDNLAENCEVSFRLSDYPDFRFNSIGFRVVFPSQ